MVLRKILLGSFIALSSTSLFAQNNEITPHGNIRVAYIGNTDDVTGIGNNDNSAADFFGLRIRYGLKYQFNQYSSFAGRLVTQLRDDTNELRFSIKADGPGIAPGTISFDEFYYQYKNETTTMKIGRFQHTVSVLSNAGRSGFRFQSNHIFVHWSDGLYLKHEVTNDWYGEAILEYQPKNNITYPYRGALDFGNADHNLSTYLALENRTRDANNFIQKGFGLFLAPNSYVKNNEYTTYALVMSRLVYDLPNRELLNGGSFRISAELGQNLNNEFAEGTQAIISAGVNKVASKHDFMIELARTDQHWLTATAYAVAADEIEFRYKYHINDKMNIDARYRARVPDSTGDTAYSTFIRFTYSL